MQSLPSEEGNATPAEKVRRHVALSAAVTALGEEGKATYYAHMRDINPARRIGTTDDVANTVLFAMSSTFLTGQTLHIDGGEPLT